ncbi:MAG: hypothetical protein COA43_14650 [Robiginitomaculum sp.]|nr:MAG: hypothetical protein COA43_14650 [Robiginitomaculum sp.]
MKFSASKRKDLLPQRPNKQSVPVIKSRIEAGTKRNQIAVFKIAGTLNKLEAYAHNIIYVIDRINSDDVNYIGSYYGRSGYKDFLADSKGIRNA